MLKIFLGFILIVLAKSQHGAPGNRTCCSPGEPGMPGLKGDNGEIGAKGDKGAEGRTRYLGQPSSCSPMNCPVGPRGSQGYDGAWGEPGLPGPPGYEGIPGRRGEMGVEGPAGPAADSVLFLPYTTSSENTCYNFQRYCYGELYGVIKYTQEMLAEYNCVKHEEIAVCFTSTFSNIINQKTSRVLVWCDNVAGNVWRIRDKCVKYEEIAECFT